MIVDKIRGTTSVAYLGRRALSEYTNHLSESILSLAGCVPFDICFINETRYILPDESNNVVKIGQLNKENEKLRNDVINSNMKIQEHLASIRVAETNTEHYRRSFDKEKEKYEMVRAELEDLRNVPLRNCEGCGRGILRIQHCLSLVFSPLRLGHRP